MGRAFPLLLAACAVAAAAACGPWGGGARDSVSALRTQAAGGPASVEAGEQPVCARTRAQAARSALAAGLEESCIVRARAVDCSGEAVGGVRAILGPWRSEAWSVGLRAPEVAEREGILGFEERSDGDGVVHFEVPPPLVDEICLRLLPEEGLAERIIQLGPWGDRPLALGPGVHDLGDLELTRLGSVRGRAVGPDGRPWAGAGVALWPRDDRGGAAEGRTDEEGRFLLSNLLPGAHTLAFEFSHAPLDSLAVTVEPGALLDLGEVTCDPAAILEGRVLDAAGRPAVLALVSARGLWIGSESRTYTDERGAFRLALEHRLPHQLEVRYRSRLEAAGLGGLAGYAPDTRDIEIRLPRALPPRPPPQAEPADPPLTDAGPLPPREAETRTLRLRVHDLLGRVPGRGTLAVLPLGSAPGTDCHAMGAHPPPPLSPVRGEDGEFALELPADADRIGLEVEGCAPIEIALPPAHVGVVDVRPVPGMSLMGVAWFGGRAAGGAWVALERDWLPEEGWTRELARTQAWRTERHDLGPFEGRRRSTLADAGGRFRFDQLPPGTWRLELRVGGAPVHVVEDLD